MASPFCDRCGNSHYACILSSHAVGETRYWLCQECQEAILRLWVIEHQALIGRQRRDRAQPDQEKSP